MSSTTGGDSTQNVVTPQDMVFLQDLAYNPTLRSAYFKAITSRTGSVTAASINTFFASNGYAGLTVDNLVDAFIGYSLQSLFLWQSYYQVTDVNTGADAHTILLVVSKTGEIHLELDKQPILTYTVLYPHMNLVATNSSSATKDRTGPIVQIPPSDATKDTGAIIYFTFGTDPNSDDPQLERRRLNVKIYQSKDNIATIDYDNYNTQDYTHQGQDFFADALYYDGLYSFYVVDYLDNRQQSDNIRIEVNKTDSGDYTASVIVELASGPFTIVTKSIENDTITWTDADISAQPGLSTWANGYLNFSYSYTPTVVEGTKTIPANLYYQFNGAISPTLKSSTDSQGNTTNIIDFTDSGTYLIAGVMLPDADPTKIDDSAAVIAGAVLSGVEFLAAALLVIFSVVKLIKWRSEDKKEDENHSSADDAPDGGIKTLAKLNAASASNGRGGELPAGLPIGEEEPDPYLPDSWVRLRDAQNKLVSTPDHLAVYVDPMNANNFLAISQVNGVKSIIPVDNKGNRLDLDANANLTVFNLDNLTTGETITGKQLGNRWYAKDIQGNWIAIGADGEPSGNGGIREPEEVLV